MILGGSRDMTRLKVPTPSWTPPSKWDRNWSSFSAQLRASRISQHVLQPDNSTRCTLALFIEFFNFDIDAAVPIRSIQRLLINRLINKLSPTGIRTLVLSAIKTFPCHMFLRLLCTVYYSVYSLSMSKFSNSNYCGVMTEPRAGVWARVSAPRNHSVWIQVWGRNSQLQLPSRRIGHHHHHGPP